MPLTDEDKDWITRQLAAQLEAVETKLLRAFHDWASPVEMRVRSHSAALRALDLEQEALADRVSKVEGNQSYPPPSTVRDSGGIVVVAE